MDEPRKPLRFSDLVGEIIVIRFSDIDINLTAKLLGVDVAGIWIESQKVTDELLDVFGVQDSRNTLVLFVPFHRIHHVAYLREGVSLRSFKDETAS